jgi:hypothetical protein
MAKMFYTAAEAAEKLSKSVDEVTEMVTAGQIQEFRDKDKVMFKVDQIDLLAGGGDDDDLDIPISLEESGELDLLSGSAPSLPSDDGEDDIFGLDESEAGSLESSASGAIGLEDSKVPNDDSFLGASGMGSGISAFDATDDSDESSGGDLLDDDLSLETVGSGSGLLDLTRESDDTSLGAELLDEVYSSDDGSGELPANASGLFEAADEESGGAVSDVGSAMPAMGGMPMVVETYEGGWSGLTVGMGLVAVAALSLVGLMAFVSATGNLPEVASMITDQMTGWFGGLFGGVIVLGVLGFFIGKASE